MFPNVERFHCLSVNFETKQHTHFRFIFCFSKFVFIKEKRIDSNLLMNWLPSSLSYRLIPWKLCRKILVIKMHTLNTLSNTFDEFV
jgi:hypothetical protein